MRGSRPVYCAGTAQPSPRGRGNALLPRQMRDGRCEKGVSHGVARARWLLVAHDAVCQPVRSDPYAAVLFGADEGQREIGGRVAQSSCLHPGFDDTSQGASLPRQAERARLKKGPFPASGGQAPDVLVIHAVDELSELKPRDRRPGKLSPVSQVTASHPDRRDAASSALGSVRAEGLDPSTAEADLAAWVRGDITDQELVERGLAAAAEQHGPVKQQAA